MLLDLAEKISEEDPFATLKLLHVCGVTRYGDVLSAVPLDKVSDFARIIDEAVVTTFDTIQQEPPSEQSTHTLPVGEGGAGLTSLEKHAAGSYLEAFFRIAGLL